MDAKRVEAYGQAVRELRIQLRTGACPPGARLSAPAIAADLKLSPTPVREALARLAGEGLLEERRGDGFFVWQLTACDVTHLYSLIHAYISIATGRELRFPDVAEGARTCDAVSHTQNLFDQWVRSGGSRMLDQAYARTQAQLGAVRRLEQDFLRDLDREADDLAALPRIPDLASRRRVLRVFFERRLAIADRLVARLVQ